MTQRNLKKERLFLSFFIVALLLGGVVAATVVGPDGIYDTDYLNGTTLYAQNIFIGNNNVTASILAGGGSGWDGTGALFQNGTRELTADWDVGAFDITADNMTAPDFYLEGKGNLTDIVLNRTRVSHVAYTGEQLEYILEHLENDTTVYVLCDWIGNSVASISLPNYTGVDITIEGKGKLITELTGRTDEATIESTLVSWNQGGNTDYFRIKHITLDADSDMTLQLPFWNTEVNDVLFNIRANANSKGILLGGSGAPPAPSLWTAYTISLRDGVTTNSIMRVWYENFVSIDASIVIQDSSITEIGNIFECFGTSSTWIKTNFHHWQRQNVTASYWYLPSSGHYANIYGIYCAESGGTDSTINSYFRVGGDSYFSVTGTVSSLDGDQITKLFYDEYSANRTDWKATWATDDAPYKFDPPPPSLTINMFDRSTSATTVGMTPDIRELVANLNNVTLDLTPYTKVAIFGLVSGGNAGQPKTIHLWDSTNNNSIVSWSWTPTANQEFYNQTVIQSLTGSINIGLAGSHATSGDLYLRRIYVVFW